MMMCVEPVAINSTANLPFDPRLVPTAAAFMCREQSPTADDDGRSSRCDSIGHEKDSGVESVDGDMTVSDELVQKIVAQVESYFADENLQKDQFLLKHIRRNKEGLVSLKLVSSFRKVKSLTKNWKLVAYSISTASTKLTLNDSETKVRRVTPLADNFAPLQNDRPRTRSLVLYNVQENATVATLSQRLAEYGDIVSVKVFRNTIPDELLRDAPCLDVSDGVVAVVEFENAEHAETAVKQVEQESQNTWRKSMRAALLRDKFTAAHSTHNAKAAARDRLRSQTIAISGVAANNAQKASFDELHMHDSYAQYRGKRSNEKSSNDKRQNGIARRGPIQRKKSNSLSVAAEKENDRLTTIARQRDNNCSMSSDRLNRSINNLVRQPRGPDGTSGFLARLTTEQKLRSRSAPLSSD